MASFQVRNRSNAIIYSIKVSEFVFRNTFSVDGNGIVTALEPTGFTSVTSIGDNIIQKLGLDNIIQEVEFEFVNNPEYYLKIDTNFTGAPITRFNDGSLGNQNITDNLDGKIFLPRLISLYVYKGTQKLASFCNYKFMEVHDMKTDTVINASNSLPNFSGPSNDYQCGYNPTFAFNFIQQQVGQISPFYYRIQNFSLSNPTFSWTSNKEIYYGQCSAIYYGKPYTVRNAPLSNTLYGEYNKNSNNFQGIGSLWQKTYGELSNLEFTTSVSPQTDGSLSQTTLGFRIYTTYKIAGLTPYEFFYQLLFDTIADNNPYPENNSDEGSGQGGSGQTTPTIGGNPNGGDKTSTDIVIPQVPSVTPVSTGSVNIYQMTPDTFRSFMSYLWTNTFYTAIVKLFENPMDCVISCHIIGVLVPTSKQEQITIGNVTTTVTANVVSNNFITCTFDSLTIPEFYGDASDYLETMIELYLPYHGYVTLNPLEVMGATLSLKYIIDILTGEFTAFLNVNKTTDDTNLNSVLYQYNGNMAYQIPLSSIDYSSFVTTALSLAGSLRRATPVQFVTGAAQDLLNTNIDYDRSGTLGGNTGYMSIKEAYITISRPIHNLAPNFAKYVGYPFEGYVNLGSCSGLTVCREVYIDNIIGTEKETTEIRRLLTEGVIF